MGAGQGSRSALESSNSSNNEKHYVGLHPEADKVWKQVFAEDAFTSLTIADFVLTKTGTSFEEYLGAPKKLKTKVDVKMIPTWSNLDVLVNGPGRCASFAVKVCTTLAKGHAGQYDFKFYNIGSHRIARCEKKKVVIDSSSGYGAFVLVNDDLWMWWKGRVHEWRYAPADKIMHFKKTHDGKAVSSKQIMWDEAIALSANQLATNPKPVLATLFRDIKDFSDEETQAMKTIFRVIGDGQNHGKIIYKAMLRWDLGKKCLECWKSLQNPESVLLISWKINGTETQEDQCMDHFNSFVETWGVQSQWTRKNVTAHQTQYSLEDIHWSVWSTATELWGKPTWSVVDMSKK